MASPLAEHLHYVSDSVRLEVFAAAIGATVRPGDDVADLGCGSGVLGMLALGAGAGHVHFIDDGAMIDVARESVARYGAADRSSFRRERCERVVLPRPVDVAVCDHVGWFGFDYGLIGLAQDARRRLLKPDGRLIPGAITLHIAAVESPECAQLSNAWAAPEVPAEFHWVRGLSTNRIHPAKLKGEHLLSAPVQLGALDLSRDQPDFLSWTAALRADRDGTLHGLAGWFDCELAPEVRMTNSPLAERPIGRAQAFLPIDPAVAVRAGDVIELSVMARHAERLFAWSIHVPSSGATARHSTWQGALLSREDLVRANPNRVPEPSGEGRAREIVLRYCDGRRTVREIEQAVLRDHAALFPSAAEIRRFVTHVLARDTR